MICRCDLKHSGQLQRPTTTVNTEGSAPAWNTYATVRAAIEPLPLTYFERQVSATIQTPVTHKVTVRYRADILAKDRFLHQGQDLRIMDLRHLDKHMRSLGTHWTELACEARAA